MRFLLLFTLLIFFSPFSVNAESLGSRLSGKILLDVEGDGEAWYVYPENNRRYYLGRPTDAFQVMRELGLGIDEYSFQQIADNNLKNVDGDLVLAKRLSGRIILQVEKNGEAWYVNPADLKKYYLGRPTDAFEIMRKLSLGVTKHSLAQVHKPGMDESIDKYSKYEHKKITTDSGTYTVDVVEIDLNNPRLRIITDTAQNFNCKENCSAKNLVDFAKEHNAFAAINGSYFDTSSAKKNYYYSPVYNTEEKKLINEDQLKYWTTGPVVAFDANNKFYYFKDSREFKSVDDFEKNNLCSLQAAISNNPRLIDGGMNYLFEWNTDNKQEKAKAPRNALGYKDGKLYLIIVQYATLYDLGDVLKELRLEYALNLDGGYSSALYYNGEYMVGPGRDIPNAILFSYE
jgi:exopolysaccharide biosynthesis protein